MEEIRFPLISPALLKALDYMYPEKTPGRTESLDDIRFKSGQRDVVRRLHEEFNRQQNHKP